MNDELGDFFALPPFKADEALVKLRRDLRELKPLVEQGGCQPVRVAYKGQPVIELALDGEGAALVARLARRPSARPDWAAQTLRSSAEVRKWLEGVRQALRRWDDED